MTLLDAYAVIALLSGGPAAAAVRDLLRSERCTLPSVNLIEVLDVCERVRGVPSARLREALDPLLDDRILIANLDTATARRAAAIRIRHYHRTDCPVSLADCVLIAHTQTSDRVATADRHLLAVAEAEGVGVVSLPGEGGL